MGVATNHQKHYKVCLFLTLLNLVLFIIVGFCAEVAIGLINVQRRRASFEFLFLINYFFYMALNITYVLVLLAVYARLHGINLYLEQQIKDVIIVNDEICSLIKMAARLYDKICDSTELINSYFSFNMISSCIQFTFVIIFFSFGIFHHLVDVNSNNNQLLYSVVTFTWILYFSMPVVWIIIISSWIKNESELIVQLFHKLSMLRNHKSIIRNVELVTLQMFHRKPLISCVLFDIDWTLALSIFGTTISYVVILIQFD